MAHRHIYRPSGLALSSLVLVLSLCACRSEKSDTTTQATPAPKESPAAPSPPSAAVAAKLPTSPGGPADIIPSLPELVVEDPGVDPVDLRYHFKVGQKKKFLMKMSVEPKVTINGKLLPGTAKTSFDVHGQSEIVSVDATGTAKRLSSFDRFTPTGGGVPPQAMAQLKAQLGLLAGLKIEEQITDKGVRKNAQIVEIPAQDPGMQSMIKNLQDGLSNAVMVFPEQKVGKGARLRATSPIETMGMAISQTTYFVVESIQNNKVVVSFRFEQSTPPTTMDPSVLPPGAKVELLGLKGTGQGKVELDLDDLNMDSKVELTMSTQTRTQAPGTTEVVNSSTDNRLQVSVKVSD